MSNDDSRSHPLDQVAFFWKNELHVTFAWFARAAGVLPSQFCKAQKGARELTRWQVKGVATAIVDELIKRGTVESTDRKQQYRFIFREWWDAAGAIDEKSLDDTFRTCRNNRERYFVEQEEKRNERERCAKLERVAVQNKKLRDAVESRRLL